MNRHPTSCTRCRTSKRKCLREQPICSRCRRLGFDCHYPAGRGPPSSTDSRRRILPRTNSNSTNQTIQSLIWNGQISSQQNGLFLLDAYFALFMPSRIIFHPQQVKRRYVQGTMSVFALDAIFSMAILLRERQHSQRHHYLRVASNGAPFPGEDWALRANTMATLQAHCPSLDTVQAFYNLAAYWCAVGRTESYLNSNSMALLSAQLVISQNQCLPAAEAQQLRQSCFWVGMNCQLLSMCETGERNGVVDSLATLQDTQLPQSDIENICRGRMITFLQVFLEARQFVNRLRDYSDPALELAALFNLDQKTSDCYESFISHITQIETQDSDERPCYEENASVQALYHTCRILPHLGMICLFQKQEPPLEEYLQLSCQIAFRHINRFSDLITSVLSIETINRLAIPPFVLYGSFISASLYLNYLNRIQCQGEAVNPAVVCLLRIRLLSNLLLLSSLSETWTPVKRLWQILQPTLRLISISSDDIKAHDTFLRTQPPYSGNTKLLSHPLPSSPTVERQLDEGVTNIFPSLVSCRMLLDPVYVVSGILQTFPIAQKTSSVSDGEPAHDFHSSDPGRLAGILS